MTRRVRLLAVHQGGGIGGAPVSLLRVVQGLTPALFEARVVFTEAGLALERARGLGLEALVEPTGGAFFYSAHARLTTRALARFIRTFPSAVRHARDVLRRERPDLLHLNTSVLVAWGAAARRERVPVVWVVREVLGPHVLLRTWHARFITTRSRRVVVTSDAVRACFPASAGNVARVYNGVDTAEFSPVSATERAAVRAELGIQPDEWVVMTVGSVQEPKGHWLLLDAFSRLLAVEPHARLVLVAGGAGSGYRRGLRGRLKRILGIPLDNLDALLREAREKGIADWVLTTGFRHDVARLLVAADLVAFPSLLPEGFGRPIIEAMAVGRPVVATDVGPSREILGDHAGVLVAPDAEALAAGLRRAIQDPRAAEAMGRIGRARVEELFTLERQVREMSAIYEAVAVRG